MWVRDLVCVHPCVYMCMDVCLVRTICPNIATHIYYYCCAVNFMLEGIYTYLFHSVISLVMLCGLYVCMYIQSCVRDEKLQNWILQHEKC